MLFRSTVDSPASVSPICPAANSAPTASFVHKSHAGSLSFYIEPTSSTSNSLPVCFTCSIVLSDGRKHDFLPPPLISSYANESCCNFLFSTSFNSHSIINFRKRTERQPSTSPSYLPSSACGKEKEIRRQSEASTGSKRPNGCRSRAPDCHCPRRLWVTGFGRSLAN